MYTWDADEEDAAQIQLQLAPRIVPVDDFRDIALIAGVSIRQLNETTVLAAVAVLDFPTMKLVELAYATMKTTFPYVSAVRAFQAGPAILAAFERPRHRPDIVLLDGHGIAHPRRCGLASHLGIVLDIPSIGVAEELVYGTCNLNAVLFPAELSAGGQHQRRRCLFGHNARGPTGGISGL